MADGMDFLVLDAGAHTIRAGRAEDFPDDARSPYVVLPSAVRSAGTEDADSAQAGSTQIFDANGCIENWDGYSGMLDYILYKQLGWPIGDEGYLLLTENTPVTMRSDREHLTQILFESFNLKGMYLLDSGVAALFASGSTSGIAVDVGLTGTNVTQVTEGAIPPGGQQRLPLGGSLHNQLLDELLRKRGVTLKTPSLEVLKEKCAAVAETVVQFDEIVSGASSSMEAETQYELPDGTKVSIKSEGHVIGESLLKPECAAHHLPGAAPSRPAGIAEATFACCQVATEPSARVPLLNCVTLCGGGALIPNLQERLMNELRSLVSHTTKVEMHRMPEYMPRRSTQFAGYIGCAIVGKGLHLNHTMTKEDYDERGPAHIHRKC